MKKLDIILHTSNLRAAIAQNENRLSISPENKKKIKKIFKHYIN